MDINGILRKIEKVPRIYRVLAILFLDVLVVFALHSQVVKPRIETEKRLSGELQDLERKLESLRNISANIEKFRREYAELKLALENVIKELPETKDVPNILRRVSRLCAESKIKVIYFEPKQPREKEFYQEFPFEMKFSGPYHDIGYFFDGIRREERIIHIVNFSLEGKGPASQPLSLEGSCTAQTYVYIPEKKKEVKKVETQRKQ